MPTDPQNNATAVAPGQVIQFGDTQLQVDELDGHLVFRDQKGRALVPFERFDQVNKRKLELESKKVEFSQEDRTKIEQEVGAKYQIQILQAKAESALTRFGLASDEEAQDEIVERYNKVKAGEDGKKPGLSEWLSSQIDAGARWVRALELEEDQQPRAGSRQATGARVSDAQNQQNQNQQNQTQTRQVNAGASRGAPAKGGNMWSRFENLSQAEKVANWAQIRNEAADAGIVLPEKPFGRK